MLREREKKGALCYSRRVFMAFLKFNFATGIIESDGGVALFLRF